MTTFANIKLQQFYNFSNVYTMYLTSSNRVVHRATTAFYVGYFYAILLCQGNVTQWMVSPFRVPFPPAKLTWSNISNKSNVLLWATTLWVNVTSLNKSAHWDVIWNWEGFKSRTTISDWFSQYYRPVRCTFLTLPKWKIDCLLLLFAVDWNPSAWSVLREGNSASQLRTKYYDNVTKYCALDLRGLFRVFPRELICFPNCFSLLCFLDLV